MNNNIVCVWDKYEDNHGNSFYKTSCHCDVSSDELNPISNRFIFCPYCSQKIVYIRNSEDEAKKFRVIESPCKQHNMEFCSECYPVVLVNFNEDK
jgi:DNA-directed RNA polymerase subunit RPC12/RpoP